MSPKPSDPQLPPLEMGTIVPTLQEGCYGVNRQDVCESAVQTVK